MATIKKKTITTSDGRTHVVKVGSKADTKYSSQAGSTTSSSASSIAKAESDIKARTSARSSSNTDAYGVSLDIANVPGTINSSTLAPTGNINLPPAPVPSNLGTNALTTLTGLAGPAQEQANTALTTAQKNETASMDQSFKEYIKSLSAPKSTEDIYKKTEREVGLKDKQQKVANLANQLQAITDKATADKLSLVGQGRGITETIIGGQQAKIDREAAIQSLPIATQLAAAQGDLELAQSHLDTLFRIRADDAQRQYDYKNKVAEAVYNYASEKQKLLIDERRTQDERNFTLKRDTISFAQSLAKEAISNGQAYLAAQLMGLDPNSASYAQDVARLSGSVSSGNSGSAGTAGFKDAKTESSVRQDAVALLADVKAGASTLEEAYSTLRTLYSPIEASDAAIKGLLGIGNSSATVESISASPIERDIQEISSNPNLSAQAIRDQLLRRGYTPSEITASSAGSFGAKTSAQINSIIDVLFRS